MTRSCYMMGIALGLLCWVALALVSHFNGFPHASLPSGDRTTAPIHFSDPPTSRSDSLSPSSEPSHYHDQRSNVCLFSKMDAPVDDLWVRDEQGHERFVSGGIVMARLSPDGTKIAYCTRDRELFVETIAGKALAQIPRVADPAWAADSAAICFQAIPSNDYPELQQTVTYDLHSGQILSTSNEQAAVTR